MFHKNNVKDWLLKFAQCVREQDFETAKGMFCVNVVGFGSRTRRETCLDDLIMNQWKYIWPKTHGFEFNFNELDFYHDVHMACVAVTWHSMANQFTIRRRRSGRATLLLVGQKRELRCAASHFSLDP